MRPTPRIARLASSASDSWFPARTCRDPCQGRRRARGARALASEAFDGYPGESEVITTWVERAGKTTMHVVVRFASQEIRDAVVGTGMAAGAGESYDQLERVLVELPAS